jgi:hypothetical protein
MRSFLKIICFIVFFSTSLCAQLSDLFYSKISKAYEKKDLKIILSGSMSFTDESLNKSINGLIYVKEDKYYSSFMNKEIIQSGNKYIYVDHTNKILVCKDAGWMNIKKDIMPVISDSSYLLRYNFKSSISKGVIHVEITPKKESEYQVIELDVNKSNFLITRIHYIFSPSENFIREFDLSYTYASINNKEDDHLFDYSRFIVENPSIKLQPKYTTYKLINDYGKN